MILTAPINKSIEQLSDKKYQRMQEGLNKLTGNEIPVFTSLRDFDVDVDKNLYPWHLKISIAAELDFSKNENLTEEFVLQYRIEKKLLDYFENTCEVKKVCSYHQKGQNVHHWYLSNCKIKLSISNIIELDGVNKQRGVNFELKKDRGWKEVVPILNKVRSISKNIYSTIKDM